MRYLRNAKVVIGLALVLCGMALILAWWLHVPAREITRAELQQFLEAKSLYDPVLTPSPYAGIYHLSGRHILGNRSEKVFLTTHLDEAELARFFSQRGLKVNLPGEGLRSQWVSILSSVSIVGLVIGVLYLDRK